MPAIERPTFDLDVRKRIYAYVERHGIVERAEVADHVGLDPDAFSHHLSMLKRDGYLEERGDLLRVDLDLGDEVIHQADEFTYTVRPGRQRDLSGVLGVVRRVAEEETYIVAESVAELVDYEDALIRHSSAKSRVFFVATVSDEVVGWVHLRVPELRKLAHTARMTLGVLEEYRGHGIGSALHRRGLDWAARQGLAKVYNSLPATNEHGVQFLVAHGWAIEAVREAHYKLGDEFVDELMLQIDPQDL